MTNEQREDIRRMREEGVSYGKIAETLNLSLNTVKSFCKRKGMGGKVALEIPQVDDVAVSCKCCGISVIQNPGRKQKMFCSDRCRNKWWNEHLDQVDRRANYEYVCPNCKKPFTAYGNSKRKYCSHSCYIADRFGGEQ